LGGQDLADVYSAMDVFAFASTSETQGIVLAEAMAAGVPVIGVDGPGTRDIVDGTNGALVPLHEEAFATALAAWHAMPKDMREAASRAARTTGASYDQGLVTRKLVAVYEDVLARPVRHELPSP
jgi:glycosyltransferase involved in cell wall biosynthesis